MTGEREVCLYLIRCSVNGKIYVGKTVTCTRRRLQDHFQAARKGSMVPLHRGIRKHGEASFSISVLCYCEPEQLNEREVKMIQILKSRNPLVGYNMAKGGDGGRVKTTYVFTDDHRRRISEAKTGKQRADKAALIARCKEMASANRGKKMSLSEDERERRRQSIKPIARGPLNWKPDTREKISASLRRSWATRRSNRA